MEESSQPKKVVFACQKCRVLKVKCIRSDEGKPCTKCASHPSRLMGHSLELTQAVGCVDRKSIRRLADLESKLSNIISLLAGSDDPVPEPRAAVEMHSTVSTSPDIFSNDPNLAPEWLNQGLLNGTGLYEGLELATEQDVTTNMATNSYVEVPTRDALWITELGLGTVVEGFLEKFRGMMPYFPFVPLDNSSTVGSMAEDRPFLLLATTSVASSKYCHVQDALNRQIKQLLSRRVIMAGEKDLDLLQGLLVYLAWFHFYFVPGTQQTYQYLQIAISMVVDLRIEQEVSDLLDKQTELDEAYLRDLCRAYLGCYYMSSTIAISAKKPNNLRFHENMLRCARMLQRRPEFETDLLIYPAIKLMQLAEEVCETYQTEGISGSQLHMQAGRFATRLEDWWLSLSADLRDTALLVNSYYAVKVRIHEMGLVYCYGRRRPPSPPYAREDLTIPSAHPKLIHNLIDCVTSTKEYLDWIFTVPSVEYNHLLFAAWYQVILAAFVLYRLSVGLSEVPEWDVEMVQRIVDPAEYFSTLLSHLHAIELLPESGIPIKSLFSRLPEIIRSVKTSYAKAKENSAQIDDTRHAHHEIIVSNNQTPLVYRQHRCPALRYSSRKSTQTPDQPALQEIAREVQSIEDEKLWRNILALDTFPSMTGPSPPDLTAYYSGL
ncbi:hypothetical protein BJY04DRAFT_233085 [Aspergillus karnatakaensis]|uniref:uncharacterized protein n=1 Tax=Aspergillus karnatakaensis TaxID=1810916 RepID=UPI003CCD78EC